MMWDGKSDSHFRRHQHHIILITSIMLLSLDYQDVGCDSDDVRMWDGEPEKSENEERRLVAVLAFVNLIASPFRRHHHYPTIHHHRVSCIQTHWQADKKLCCIGSVKIEIAAITLLLSLLQIPEFAFQDFRVLVSFSRFLKSGWLFQIAACSILIWPRSANALVGGAFDAIFKATLSTSTSLWSCFLFDRQIVDLRISEGVSRRKSISIIQLRPAQFSLFYCFL